MSIDLDAAVTRVQAIVRGISGITQAPSDPPDQISTFPFSVCWLSQATWVLADATCANADGVIVLEIHWSRTDLARTISHAMDYCESIPKAVIADHNLNSNLDIIRSMTGTMGPMLWGTTETFGWHFELAFGGHEAIT